MAKTYTPIGLGACLLAGNEYTGTRYQDWRAANETQRRALMLNPTDKEIGKVPELERWAKDSHVPLNKILAERRFALRFDPFAPGHFGVLSILKLRVDWLKEGTKERVRERFKQKDYPGFRLHGKGCGVSVSGSGTPIARIATKSGDVVWIQMTDDAPKDDIAAAEAAHKLLSEARRRRDFEEGDFTGPCVCFRESRDLSWLAGLNVPGSIVLDSGYQETIFGMNRTGAVARVATGGGMIMACIQHERAHYRLDGPAIVAIERPGLRIPVFSAYITPADWKDPGNLDEL